MKIAVESSVLARINKTGVDYYVRDLMRETVKLMPNDHFELCYLKFFGRPAADLEVQGKNVVSRRVSFLPGKVYNAFERYFITIPYDFVTRLRADIYVYPNFIYWPLWFTKKSIVFVHDLGYIDQPDAVIARHRKYLGKFVPYSINKAAHVMTISEHTKKRIVEVYGTNPKKITVATPAVDHQEFTPQPKSNIELAKKKYKISDDYILFLGTVEPRKNIVGLLKAYDMLPAATKSKYQLVLAGGKGWLDDEINTWCEKLGNRVVRTGYIDAADKPALYSGASVFTYPSLYEGWGMQPLEAMACGVPVITANNSSLPEVAGDAAILVEATNHQELADQIEEVLTNKTLASELVKKGYIQAKKFSWEKSAAVFKRVLEEVNAK